MENLADLLGFALLIFSLLAYLFFRHRPKMKDATKALRTFGRAATTQIWLSANRPHIRSNHGQVDDSIRRRLWNVLPGLRLLYGALVTLGRVLTFWATIVTGLRSSVVSSSLWRRLERQLSTRAGASALLQGASVLSTKNLARVAAIGVVLIAIPPQKEDEKGDLAQTIEGRGEERRAQAAPGSTAATSPTETLCIPTELSPASVALVRLYEELHTFVNDPLFGFGRRDGPYFAWLQNIKKHRDTRYEMLDELGFQPNEVMMLGMNYASTFSESTRRAIEYFEMKIQAGLASARCTEPGLEWQEILQAASEARLSYSEATHQEAVAKHLSTNLSVENYLTEEVRGQVLRLERAIDVGEADGRDVLALLEAPPELPILTTEEQASVDNWRSSLRQRLELNMASFLGLRESIRELRELRGAPN